MCFSLWNRAGKDNPAQLACSTGGASRPRLAHSRAGSAQGWRAKGKNVFVIPAQAGIASAYRSWRAKKIASR